MLVTGATGFLGGMFVQHLLRAGLPQTRLRCLVRDRARATAGGLPDASLRDGDLGDPGIERTLPAALNGVSIVVHLAGTLKGRRPTDYEAVNVGGTARLVRAVAVAAPRAHFVQVSSIAAAGPSLDGSGSAAMPDRCRPVSHYGDSKRRAELELVRSALAWTIVRPPVVYGSGDGATRLLFRQVCAPVTVVPRRASPLSVIHAEDVVRALAAAVAATPAGAVLPLDGPERTDTHAFVRAIAVACGRRVRLVRVPMAVAGAAAAVSDAFAALSNRTSYFNRDKVRELGAPGWVADGGPAKAALGFEPRIRLAEGLLAVARIEGFACARTA